MPHDPFELLATIHVAEIVERVADDRNVDAADLLRLEHILDGGWNAALLRRANVLVKVRCRESILVSGRENVGVKVDDHIRFSSPFGLINKAFLDLKAWKLRLAASDRGGTR